MLFKPKWAKVLFDSPNFLMSDDKVKRIETLRKAYNLSHELMAGIIGNCGAMSRNVQRNILNNLRQVAPDASEKELWLLMLSSRAQSLQNFILYSLESGAFSDSEADDAFGILSSALEKGEEIITEIGSFENLCDYLISLDEIIVGSRYKNMGDGLPPGLLKQISDILS